MSFVQSAPSGDPSLRDPESERTPPGGTPASALASEAPAAPAPAPAPANAELASPAPAFSFAGFAGQDPWALGVADAAAEFQAMQAGALARVEPAELPAQPAEPSSIASEPSVTSESAPIPAPELVQAVAPEPTEALQESEQVTAQPPSVVTQEPAQALAQAENPFVAQEPVSDAAPAQLWPSTPEVAAPAVEPVQAPPAMIAAEPVQVVEPPAPAEPAPVEPAAAEATAAAPAPSEPHAFSVDWAPPDEGAAAAPSPSAVSASAPELHREEPASPGQSPAEGGGYIEKYQRLFSGEAVDPERAILAAIDAVIQGPSSEGPRGETPALAAIAPAPVVSLTASGAAERVAFAGTAPAPTVVPASTEAVLAPVAAEPHAPGAVAPSAPPEAAAPNGQASKLDLGKDVDWSEDALARAARAAAAAATRARAAQQAELAAAGAISQKAAAAPVQARSQSTPPESARGRAQMRSEVDDGLGERVGRHRSRKGRRGRFEATPLFLFAFVGCVMVALGVGFVTGFMVGRETPRSADAMLLKPAEPAQVAAAEPAASADEAEAPSGKRKGALTARVEGVVPQPGAASNAGDPAAGAVAPGAAAKYQRGPFDAAAAGLAVVKAGARAGVCVPPGDAGGDAIVTVTLDPSGVTSSAAVYGARFAGTQAGECIANIMRKVKVRPFAGDSVTIKKTIQVQ